MKQPDRELVRMAAVKASLHNSEHEAAQNAASGIIARIRAHIANKGRDYERDNAR